MTDMTEPSNPTRSADRPVAVVTGAASGIGRAIARRLLADGYAVGLCDRDPVLRSVFEDSLDRGDALGVVGDVGDAATRSALVDETVAHYGGIDVLVNNAATGGAGGPLASMDLDAFSRTLEINVVAVVGLTQLALPHLTRSARGRVINLGSLFADEPARDGGDYCASKGAIHSLTRAMAVEFGPDGVTCNAIAPGFILTPMHREEVEMQAQARGVDAETRYGELREQVPVGRHGTPEDVAGAAAWLASEESEYVTGLKVTVNGGVSFS